MTAVNMCIYNGNPAPLYYNINYEIYNNKIKIIKIKKQFRKLKQKS